MTQRLYYQDSFLREFDAQVLSVEPAPAPSGRAPDALQWHVVLDRTAFYPASSGQPHDTGKLADTAVVDVFERHDHSVHVTGQVFEIGAVHGLIDWERRFDHMQQHTGQHLLSAAFLKLFKLPTVSFHLGREVSTNDLSAAGIEPAQLEQAEHRVNQIVFEDRPAAVRFGTAEELAKAGIRKKVEPRASCAPTRARTLTAALRGNACRADRANRAAAHPQVRKGEAGLAGRVCLGRALSACGALRFGGAGQSSAAVELWPRGSARDGRAGTQGAAQLCQFAPGQIESWSPIGEIFRGARGRSGTASGR